MATKRVPRARIRVSTPLLVMIFRGESVSGHPGARNAPKNPKFYSFSKVSKLITTCVEITIQARRAISKPPLHVAGGIRARVEGVQRRLRGNRQGRRTDIQPQIGVGDGALHGGRCIVVKAPRRGLQVQDQGLQALTPSLVHDRLKSTVVVLDFGLPFVPTDGGGLLLHARDVRLQGSHHLHGLHVLHGVHGDGSFRGVLVGLRELAARSGVGGLRVF